MSSRTTLRVGSLPPSPPPFRPRQQGELPAIDAEQVFGEIYLTNAWNGTHSFSGTGSDLFQTRVIAREIPALCAELAVSTMLDVPCGDFHWMSRVDLDGVDYTGADIVDALIISNQARFGGADVRFAKLNLLTDELPCVDLILCRDCLVHLPFNDVFTALGRICASESKYLLTTTFPDRTDNADIEMGDWRPLNLQRAPFTLPAPLRMINEGCTEGDGFFDDKSLGLWRVADIRQALERSVF